MAAVTLVETLVEAFNARDLDRFVGCFSTDARYDALQSDGTVQILAPDRAALRAIYGPLFAQSPDLHVDIIQRMHVGSWVIDEEEISGCVFEGFPSAFHTATIYRLEGDAIVHASAVF